MLETDVTEMVMRRMGAWGCSPTGELRSEQVEGGMTVTAECTTCGQTLSVGIVRDHMGRANCHGALEPCAGPAVAPAPAPAEPVAPIEPEPEIEESAPYEDELSAGDLDDPEMTIARDALLAQLQKAPVTNE